MGLEALYFVGALILLADLRDLELALSQPRRGPGRRGHRA